MDALGCLPHTAAPEAVDELTRKGRQRLSRLAATAHWRQSPGPSEMRKVRRTFVAYVEVNSEGGRSIARLPARPSGLQ
jgi:hypothetical protein